jgi:hypothetical protein
MLARVATALPPPQRPISLLAAEPIALRTHPVRISNPRIATSLPRAKFKAQKQANPWWDLGNASLKKIFAILNLTSCF